MDASVAGVIVGIEDRRFEREGISVKLVAGRNDDESLDYVASNPNSIGIVNAYSFLLARARSVPVVAFAAPYQRSPIVFYTLTKSRIRSPEDFASRTVGCQPDSTFAIVYEALMAKSRVARSRIKEIVVTPDPTLLANGTVDVLPGYVGQMQTLRRMGLDVYPIDPAQFGIHAPGTVYFSKPDLLRTNPELIRRFLRGLIDGWEIAYEDYAKSIPTIAQVLGKDFGIDDIRSLLEQQREFLRPLGGRLGGFSRSQWSFAQNDLLQQRRLASAVDIAAATNDDLLTTVVRERGPPK